MLCVALVISDSEGFKQLEFTLRTYSGISVRTRTDSDEQRYMLLLTRKV